VSERLGNANIGITLDHYSHVSEAMQREAAAGLDALIDNQKPDEDGGGLGKAL
jgi:hypothetical protein